MALSFQGRTHDVALKIMRALWIALGRDESELDDVSRPPAGQWMGAVPAESSAACFEASLLCTCACPAPEVHPGLSPTHTYLQPFDIDSEENPSFLAWNHCE